MDPSLRRGVNVLYIHMYCSSMVTPVKDYEMGMYYVHVHVQCTHVVMHIALHVHTSHFGLENSLVQV